MPRFAYFFSTFPALSTTFVQHQVAATQKLGLDPVLISTRPPAPRGYHPEDEGFLHQTLYLNQLPWRRYMSANLKAVFRSPGRYLKAVKLALGLKDDFPWQRLRNLMHVAAAALLAERLAAEGVVHIHVHFAFGAAGIAIFLGVLADIPYSLTIHGSDVLLPRPLTEEKVRRAKFVVSNCRFHIDNLRRRFPSLASQRFYVVSGGVDTLSRPWSRTEPLDPQGPLRLLNVARLEPVKAQDLLIEACARLRERGVDFHCRIVGDGPRKGELEALVARLGLGDRVELMGSRYQEEVSELCNWAQIIVLSSLSEGTPMTVIEGMAKARPVVVPNITALPEMVVEGKTGLLFEKGSAEDLADRLAQLAGNPRLMESMGRESRKRAEECFDLTRNALRLLAVFAREVPALALHSGVEVDYE